MKIAGKKLRIVILRRVYDVVNEPVVQSLLPKLIALKVNGYRREYPYGMLPLDTTDYIGDHLMLCEETASGLTPLMAYKSYTLAACTDFHIPFPVLEYVRANGGPEYCEAMSQILDRCIQRKRSLAYIGSGAVSNETKSTPEIHKISKDLFKAMYPLFHTYLEPVEESVSFGSVRFKVDQHLRFWGFDRIQLNGTPLPDLYLHSHFGEQATMSYLCGPYSEESLQFAEQYRSLWDEKLVIGDPTKVRTKDIEIGVAA